MAQPRPMPPDIEQRIRDCARQQMGKQDTAAHLGISRYALRLLAQAMPDIQWVCRSHTKNRLALYETMRRDPKYRDRIKRAKSVQLKNLQVHEYEGVKGSIRDLYDHFESKITVRYNTVLRRVSDGWPLHDALFQPPYHENQQEENHDS